MWGQGAAEPVALVTELIEERAQVGPLEVFCCGVLSDALPAAAADRLDIASYGALAGLGPLAASGALNILPTRMSDLPALFEDHLRPDVLFVGVAPADSGGHHSLSLGAELVADAVGPARAIVAEVNDQLPALPHAPRIHASRFLAMTESSRAPLGMATRSPTATDLEVAAHVAALVDDGATVQLGVGTLPEAVARLLLDHADLGVHTGMLSDGLARLVEAGVVTNARARHHPGRSVTGAIVGTPWLYDFVAEHPQAFAVEPVSKTHAPAVLAACHRLVAINSAIEVDLTGQVNAEQAGSAYIGAIGGQADFARGAQVTPGGRSVVALSARTSSGRSRIVAALGGPVTVARCDADWVVTEFGAAALRGRSLTERATALIAIAHPDDRAQLEQNAAGLHGRWRSALASPDNLR